MLRSTIVTLVHLLLNQTEFNIGKCDFAIAGIGAGRPEEGGYIYVGD